MKQPTLVLLVPLNSFGSQTWVQTPRDIVIFIMTRRPFSKMAAMADIGEIQIAFNL